MLTSVSLVVFWRYFLSKIVWLIKNLFYRFLNLSLAIFLTYYLIFLCILSLIFLKRMFLKIKKTCKRAAKLLLQYQVANLVEKYAIPHSMIMNFDQTPSTFAPVSSRALDIRGTSHVDIFWNQILYSLLFATVHIFFRNIIFCLQTFVLPCEPLHNLGPFFLFSLFQYSETVMIIRSVKKS